MQKNVKFDVIGFGATAVDDLLHVEKYPKPDTKTQIFARERQAGGLTGTAMVTAARLETQAAYFGALGNDSLSTFTKDEFIQENVDISSVINMHAARPLHSTVIIDQSTHERTIFYSTDHFNPLETKEIPKTLCRNTKFLFMDTFVLPFFPTLVSIAKKAKTPMLIDVESTDIAQQKEAFDAIEYIFLNKKLAEKMTHKKLLQKIFDALQSSERICIVITDGKDGCWFQCKNRPVHYLAAFPVNAIDTTGCGDVFHGAFTAALIHGKSIQEAVRWGAAAAAMKATQPGGRKGIPSKPELERFLKHNQNHPVEYHS